MKKKSSLNLNKKKTIWESKDQIRVNRIYIQILISCSYRDCLICPKEKMTKSLKEKSYKNLYAF
jgi:hypothetical protein